MNVKILYEDNDIIVVVKPAGMPSQSDKSMTMDMVSYLKNYIAQKTVGKEKENGVKTLKDGVGRVQTAAKKEPYISVVHRLDRPVGGVMVYAKTPEAAAGISSQIQNNTVKKKYMAVLTGTLKENCGERTDWLLKDGRTNTSKTVPEKTAGAKQARLYYEIIKTKQHGEDNLSLARIELFTGRHHQIRVQMAAAGAGIYGDTKYNPEFQNKKGWFEMGLFSYYLAFKHPKTKKTMIFEQEPSDGIFSLFF